MDEKPRQDSQTAGERIAKFLSDPQALAKSISPRAIEGMRKLTDSITPNPDKVIYQNGGLVVTPRSLHDALHKLTRGRVRAEIYSPTNPY